MFSTIHLTRSISRVHAPLLVLVLLFTAHATFNFLLNPSDERTSSQAEEIWTGARLGFMFAQPLMLAIWAVFGPLRAAVQISVSLLTLLLLSVVADASDRTGPLVFSQSLMATGIWFLAALTLWPIRHWGRWRIRISETAQIPIAVEWQFDLRWLLVCVSVAALVSALGRFALSNRDAGGETDTLGMAAAGIVMFFALMAGGVGYCAMVLASRGWWWFGGLGLILSISGIFIAMQIIAIFSGKAAFVETTLAFAILQTGALASIVFTLLPLRWCGYRLVREQTLQGDGA